MTTVAYRMGMIAADTGVNIGDARVGEMTKITRHPQTGALAGASGGAGFCAAFLAWFLKGEEGSMQEWLDKAPTPGSFEDDSVERGFAVFPAKPNEVWVLEPDGWFTLPCPYYATGGGRELAMGCMWKGGDAQEAVSAAMTHHCFTFGTVEHLRF